MYRSVVSRTILEQQNNRTQRNKKHKQFNHVSIVDMFDTRIALKEQVKKNNEDKQNEE